MRNAGIISGCAGGCSTSIEVATENAIAGSTHLTYDTMTSAVSRMPASRP